jgi:hypothetical protein
MNDPCRIVEIKEVSAKCCPFCGRQDIRTLRTKENMWATICYPFEDGCGARTDYHFSAWSSRAAWDRRVDPT